jgi:transposase
VSARPGGCVPTLFGASERDDESSMAAKKRSVTGGVDTHGKTHHAAVIDQLGQLLGDQQFPATAAGYRLLLAWLRSFGRLVKVGVEGTGTYGAGLARYLAAEQVEVVEVDRPDRKTRRNKGKSDPIDAMAAARAVLSGQSSGKPKTRTGPVEAIRALRVARRGAVKARTAAMNQLHGLITSAPLPLHEELRGLSTAEAVSRCAALVFAEAAMTDPVQATAAALHAIAGRVQALTAEIAEADKRLRPAVSKTAPRLSALHGVGPEVAGQLLATVGDNRRTAAQRGRSGPPVRSGAATRELRPHRPSPTQPRRRPRREQRALHDRLVPHASTTRAPRPTSNDAQNRA